MYMYTVDLIFKKEDIINSLLDIMKSISQNN